MSEEGNTIASESSKRRAVPPLGSAEEAGHSVLGSEERLPIGRDPLQWEGEQSQGKAESLDRTASSPDHPPDLDTSLEESRQVIAVSASKGPAAFFNLARKFLVTDEYCDLSALETAIVSAVDAAHLLERSKLATIVRVQTSYVKVETRRRGSASRYTRNTASQLADSTSSPSASTNTSQHQRPSAGGDSGKEVRRARIVITVKRTEDYRIWLEENISPMHGIISSADDDDGAVSALSR